MNIDSYDIYRYFSGHPILGKLTGENRDLLLDNLDIAYARAGDKITFAVQSTPGILILRSGGMEIRDKNGRLEDKFGADDLIIPPPSPDFELHCMEDSLYYEVLAANFTRACENEKLLRNITENWERRFKTRPGASPFPFSPVNMRESFNSLLPTWGAAETGKDDFSRVAQHMHGPIISTGPTCTITQAAKIMQQHKISALLIADEEGLKGILTDKDLRNRVLAAEIPPNTPVHRVMTPNPISIPSTARLHEARLKMMSKEIRHLVVTEDNAPVGMISANDLFKADNLGPLPLMNRVKKAKDVDTLVATSKLMPELVAKLIERNMRPSEIGELITGFADGLTRRLIMMAEEQLGKAPCGFTWLAFGSQARQEQVLGSDQDNALLLSDSFKPDMGTYFEKLANFVNDGLHLCGFVYCPGEIMARNPLWRLTYKGWKERFNHWIDEPEPKALMHASIFFDMRAIYGDTTLQQKLQQHVLNKAQKNTIFQAYMSGNAMQHRPPLGFFKNFVLEHDGDHANELDLKKRGTIPIVDIARNYALAHKITAVNTVERLSQIRDHKALSADIANSLIDAHEFIAHLRLAAQAEEFRAAQTIDNYLNPKSLSPLQRHQLKEAFQSVRESQHLMQLRFNGSA